MRLKRAVGPTLIFTSNETGPDTWLKVTLMHKLLRMFVALSASMPCIEVLTLGKWSASAHVYCIHSARAANAKCVCCCLVHDQFIASMLGTTAGGTTEVAQRNFHSPVNLSASMLWSSKRHMKHHCRSHLHTRCECMTQRPTGWQMDRSYAEARASAIHSVRYLQVHFRIPWIKK